MSNKPFGPDHFDRMPNDKKRAFEDMALLIVKDSIIEKAAARLMAQCLAYVIGEMPKQQPYLMDAVPLSSDKSEYYNKLRENIGMRVPNSEDVTQAIEDLCRDNERLAIRSQASTAAALRKASQVAYTTLHPKNDPSDWTSYARQNAEMADVVRDEIRAMITQDQEDSLQVMIDSAVVADTEKIDKVRTAISLALETASMSNNTRISLTSALELIGGVL